MAGVGDIYFRVQVNPEVTQKFNQEKIQKLSTEFNLNATELKGDGIQPDEVPGMQLETFKKLSGGTGTISNATLIKFDDGQDTPLDKYADQIRKALPNTFGVSKTDEGIYIQSQLKDTKDQTFTLVGGKDKNNDGSLDMIGEIKENDLVKTMSDAKVASAGDYKGTPEEIIKFYLNKKGVDSENKEIKLEAMPTSKSVIKSEVGEFFIDGGK